MQVFVLQHHSIEANPAGAGSARQASQVVGAGVGGVGAGGGVGAAQVTLAQHLLPGWAAPHPASWPSGHAVVHDVAPWKVVPLRPQCKQEQER